MLSTLLAATIAMAAPGPATEAAQQPFCRPVRERPTRMQEYRRYRRMFGFRSDRAYVRRLIRRGVYSGDILRIPVTPREKRYLRIRDRLDLSEAGYRYLRRRPAVDGGISIEDDWPRDPYLLVRVTRDRREHTRALRRLVPRPRLLRTKLVAISERALGRLQDRIDWEAAERDGFHVTTSAPDIDRSVVELELITKRTDHEAYFRERYGSHVSTRLIATELFSPACRNLHDYVADGARLTIGWEAGGSVEFDRVEVAEHDDRVVIGVVVQSYNGPQTADSRREDHMLTLSRPLGGRRVIDATTGERVRLRAPLRPPRAR